MSAHHISATAFTLLIVIFSASLQEYKQSERGQIQVGAGKLVHYEISRLLPAAFPQLPFAVRTELEKRSCRVPQSYEAWQRGNVISGNFGNVGSVDWAVLCSRRGYSSILVFWKGSAQSVAELARRKDTDDMQVMDIKGNLAYARIISTATPDLILKRERNWKLRPFEHDGIEDGLQEKGSLIRYLRGENWIELEGAD